MGASLETKLDIGWRMVGQVNALNVQVWHTKETARTVSTRNFFMAKEKIERGDLVATYYLNTSMVDEELLQYGVVVDVNDWIGDILVLDNNGQLRWWGRRRWRVLKKKNAMK